MPALHPCTTPPRERVAEHLLDVATRQVLRSALQRVREARAEQDRLDGFADAAFARYFAKRERGEPANGAAWQRAQNRASYHSADLEGLEIDACRLLDQIPGTWDLDRALRELS